MGSTNGSSWVLGVSDGTQVNIRARRYQSLPDGNGYLYGTDYGSGIVAASLNDRGDVAFTAFLGGTSGGLADNDGIFVSSEEGLTQLVRKGDLVPGGTGRF